MYKLYHYSDSPLMLSKDHFYNESRRFKPTGLWLSVGNDWAKWCRREKFNLPGLSYRTEVTLIDTSKILYVRSQEDLDMIEKEYEEILQTYFPFCTCNWAKMKEKYDGIIIDQDTTDLYANGFRNGGMMDWIETWDVLSGCVWNFDIIQVGKTKKLS